MNVWILSLILALPAAANDKKEVETLIRGTVDKVLALLADKKLAREERRTKVLKTVETILDFELMAKLSLGKKHWGKFDAKQRQTFTGLFVEQLKSSYFEKLDLYTDERVEFGEAAAKGDKFQMRTHIITKDRPVEMLYRLYRKGASWRVYDVEIEGVSIVKSYGSQYDEVLRGGTVEELLDKMREKKQS